MHSNHQRIDVPALEDSVVLDHDYPSVKERYFNHYYYIPKTQVTKIVTQTNEELDINSSDDLQSPSSKKQKLEECNVVPKKITDDVASEKDPTTNDLENNFKKVTGHETLVMIHTNKICIVSLSPFHPIVQNKLMITKIDYDAFGIDRLSNKVSGKGKRGAQVMGSKATICRLHTIDGQTFDVTCGARGKLLQVNESLIEKPDLARTNWGSEGFLAAVMPRLPDFPSFVSCLTSAIEYEQLYQTQHPNCV